MSTEFALDLRLARRKAGFTQRDCAHLLAITPARLSDLESGRRLPSLTQICTLSLIYGRNFDSVFGAVLSAARANLRIRILAMPKDTRDFAGTRNREYSVERLARDLAKAEDHPHGGA